MNEHGAGKKAREGSGEGYGGPIGRFTKRENKDLVTSRKRK